MSGAQSHCEHMSLDWLSAYLDHELEPVEEQEVELHLSGCERCQRRLEGLTSVVGGLRELDRLQPPPLVEEALRHEISIQAQRKSKLWQRVERLSRPRSFTGPLFALVLALSVIVVLYSIGLERASRPATEVIVPPPGEPRLEAAGRVFFLVVEPPGPESAGETLRRSAQSWVENGVEAATARSVDAASEEARAVMSSHPEILPILQSGRDVVVDWEGEPLRLHAVAQSVQTPID